MIAMAGSLFAPADSARAVAQVYSVSLLATAPLAAALAAATLARRAPAGTRAPEAWYLPISATRRKLDVICKLQH